MAVLPTLQAFHYFTEYLVARGFLDGESAAQLQAAAAADFAMIQGLVKNGHPAFRIHPTYEGLIAGDRLWREA